MITVNVNKENRIPKVGGKKFSYTKAGKKAAKKYAKRTGKRMTKSKTKRKRSY